MAGIFSEKLTKLLHPNMTLAPELVQTFDWLEEQGWLHIREGGAPEDHYLTIYPEEIADDPRASFVTFGGTSRGFTDHQDTPDPDVNKRIAEIAMTAGDGGYVSIWLDDAGEQWFVHTGHDVIGTIGQDPVKLLQFLAMGYGEPGGLEETDITPLEQAMAFSGVEDPADFPDDEGPTIPPTAFQNFVMSTFGVTLPETARDLGIADFSYYDDADSTDPFVQWMIQITPPPTEEDLAYFEELAELGKQMASEDFDMDAFLNPPTFWERIKSFFGLQK